MMGDSSENSVKIGQAPEDDEESILLIGLVENRRFLYDSEDPKYKDRNATRAAWSYIADLMGKGNDTTYVKNRWKSLKDYYQRRKKALEGKSGQARKKIENWAHFKSMKFLDTCVNENESTLSNLDHRSPDCEDAGGYAAEIVETPITSSRVDTNSKKPLKKRRLDTSFDDVNERILKRKRKFRSGRRKRPQLHLPARAGYLLTSSRRRNESIDKNIVRMAGQHKSSIYQSDFPSLGGNKYSDYMMDERDRHRDRGGGTSKGALMPSPQRLVGASAVNIGASDPNSPGDGEDGGFQERLIPRKTSVETQTMSDDSYYQRKITPRVPKRCKIAVYLATGTAIIIEPEKGSSATAKDILQAIVESEELALPPYAAEVFSIWMASSFLEVQLKPNQQPLGVRKNWKRLLHNYSTATHLEAESDEPRICLRRSAYFTKRDEMRIKDGKILELFYAEARHNILSGRYPCEVDDYSTLGALQAGIEMGSFNPEIHTLEFFRQNQRQFLPEHVCEATWIPSFLLGRRNNSPSFLVLENFRRIPPTTPSRKLVRKYMELCWSLPYYGSAMFHGQVESPSKGLWSFLDHPDNFVLVAINSHSLHVIDYYRNRILVGARFESFKVELGWPSHPSHETNPNCFPCLFLQFQEPDSRHSKMLQIFSKQAPMMDSLITRFHKARSRSQNQMDSIDELDGGAVESSELDGDFLMSLKTVTQCGDETSCLSNKLGELSLATFDQDGLCIGQSGSWAFAQ